MIFVIIKTSHLNKKHIYFAHQEKTKKQKNKYLESPHRSLCLLNDLHHRLSVDFMDRLQQDSRFYDENEVEER